MKAVLCCCLSLGLSTCWADYIRLNTGQEIRGTVESDKHGQLKVRTAEGLLTFSRSQVASISQHPKTQNLGLEIEHAAGRAELSRLATLISKANLAEPGVATGILKHSEKLIAAATTQPRADLHRFLESTTGTLASAPPEFALLLVRMQAAVGEAVPAAKLVLTQPTAPLLQTPELRRNFAQALLECADQLVDTSEEELTGRILALLDLVQADAPSSHAPILLKTRASQKLADAKRWKEAVSVFADSPPGGAAYGRRQLLAILQGAERAADTTGTAEAGQLILQQHASWFGEPDLEQLRYTTAMALANASRFDEAFAIADTWSKSNADKAAKLQHQVELAKRRSQLAADQPMQAYKLAVWAREMGLLEEAGTMLATISAQPLISDLVALQQQLLELDYAKAEFARITAAFQAHDYKAVITQAQRFRKTYGDAELTRRALELEQLAKYYDTNKTRHAQDAAGVAYLNAERMFNQGRYDECAEQLRRLLIDYPASQSAQSASRLLDKATQALARKQKQAPG